MRNVIERAKEPSTWAGLGVLVETIAPAVGLAPGYGTGLAAIFGGLAVILRERRS
jgi:hypothetical protein